MPSIALNAIRTNIQSGISRNGQRSGARARDEDAERDRHDGRGDRDLVRGDAGAGESRATSGRSSAWNRGFSA